MGAGSLLVSKVPTPTTRSMIVGCPAGAGDGGAATGDGAAGGLPAGTAAGAVLTGSGVTGALRLGAGLVTGAAARTPPPAFALARAVVACADRIAERDSTAAAGAAADADLGAAG